MVPTQWRSVGHGEQLAATIYEFRPNNLSGFLTPTKISLRHNRSLTTNTSTPRALAFRNLLLRRDVDCIITHDPIPTTLVSSHLIPRRLGDAGVQDIIHRFTGSPIQVARYDPTIGILLFTALDIHADNYNLGFWYSGTVSLLTGVFHACIILTLVAKPNQYVVHNFFNRPLTINGMLSSNDEPLHGTQVTLSAHDSSISLPPLGVFDWHYVQCVLKKFSTPDYQGIDNIHYFVFPFHTRDDDDDDRDFDDDRNLANPPYPSYFWDLYQMRNRERLEAEERNRDIVTWNPGVEV
jgi:hypothetical protein